MLIAADSHVSQTEKTMSDNANSTSLLLCYYLNAVVVFSANRSIHKWMLARYQDISTISSSSSSFMRPVSSEAKIELPEAKTELV